MCTPASSFFLFSPPPRMLLATDESVSQYLRELSRERLRPPVPTTECDHL